jgi:hypothetical protein
MKKMIHIALINLALIGPAAHAETRCERISDNYMTTGRWSRDCGPEPGKPFAEELRKDCLQTVRQIQARPGASWNSENGWASESQCESVNGQRG